MDTMKPCIKASRYDGKGTSVNAIFALTGPSAGVLHIRSGMFPSRMGTFDESVVSVLNTCWEALAVPADQYWRAASQHHTLFQNTDSSGTEVRLQRKTSSAPSLLPEDAVKRPDPSSIPRSFYSTRLDAISKRHYLVDNGMLLIAVDKRNGSGGKMFNTLRREELPSFIGAVPLYQHRNFYLLMDENAAVDPFFDIDYPLPFHGMTNEGEKGVSTGKSKDTANFSSSSPSLTESSSSLHVATADVEQWLEQILYFLRDKVEAATGARLKECLVLTSSVLVHDKEKIDDDSAGNNDKEKEDDMEEGTSSLISSRDSKISFHVHFRLDGNTAFANVRELHKFMSRVREELDVSISMTDSCDTVSLHRMLRNCIDFGVYTRWRAFRLPYNVKAPSSDRTCPADTAVMDLMIMALSQSSLRLASVPDVDVGAVAPSVVQSIDLSSLRRVFSPQQQQQQHRMMTKLFFLFRFLLPIIPGKTNIMNKNLLDFLSNYAPRIAVVEENDEVYNKNLVRAVFDLAGIQRDNPIEAKQGGSNNSPTTTTTTTVPLCLIALDQSVNDQKASATSLSDPFALPRPPHRDGARMPVHDKHVKDLVAEVFRCLSAAYDGRNAGEGGNAARHTGLATSIVGNRISVQYQENIRAYYAQQKLSKFCLNQGREHRGTYPQLYLTYGSIKLRCYSNDCHQRCLAVKWSVDEGEQAQSSTAVVLPVDRRGYPNYERLAQLRHLLFPPLPPEELLRRYGSSALGGVLQQQQQQPQEQEQEQQ